MVRIKSSSEQTRLLFILLPACAVGGRRGDDKHEKVYYAFGLNTFADFARLRDWFRSRFITAGDPYPVA